MKRDKLVEFTFIITGSFREVNASWKGYVRYSVFWWSWVLGSTVNIVGFM